ncbi:hypothetical protein SSX86_003750 [Deinandra increscens subsp. villosa]|uniref:Uncharacterized protein n=1 Tax=Deinandra increscens subsp. villosa TaxID=3103831 RepID=A0AAP0DME0_9ASTR
MSRRVGRTEHSWCRAVPGGTDVAVSALLFSKNTRSTLPSILHPQTPKLPPNSPLQTPKLPSDSPALQIQTFDLAQSFHLTLENEMNTNPWLNFNQNDHVTLANVMFAVACDRVVCENVYNTNTSGAG